MSQISDDLEDLESVLKKEGKRSVIGSGKCSALVKLLEGNKELFVAQDTWSGYNTMLRILKKYSFGYHLVPGYAERLIFFVFACVFKNSYLSLLSNVLFNFVIQIK